MAKFNWTKHKLKNGWTKIFKSQLTEILGGWIHDGDIALGFNAFRNSINAREERQARDLEQSPGTIPGDITESIEPQIPNVYWRRNISSQNSGNNRQLLTAGRRAGKSEFLFNMLLDGLIEYPTDLARSSGYSLTGLMAEQVVLDESGEGDYLVSHSEEP